MNTSSPQSISNPLRVRCRALLRQVARTAPVLMLALLAGCFEVKDELKLEADGSGTVRIESKLVVPAEMASMMQMGGMRGEEATVMYPPTSEAEARKFFPGKDFTVTVKQERKGEETVTVVDAAFKDINALLKSPYGRARSLVLKIENGALTLRALTGVEMVARMSEVKDEGGMFGFGAFSSLPNADKSKKKMRAEFRLTLPNAISTGNGTRDGKTATWTFDQEKAKDTTEFADQLGGVLEAGCAADGIKVMPASPPRLGLGRFGELTEASFAEKGAGPDEKAIAAAAKFVPYALRVTRSLDLSGSGSARRNQAQLMGAVVLPAGLAPQRWGSVKLEEAVDAKGNDLKPEERDGGFDEGRFSHMTGMIEGDGEAGDDQADVKIPATEQRHSVTLQFHPPDWKVKEIARIRASIELQYFGGAHVVKITNAIPAAWVREMKSEADFGAFGGLDNSEKVISAPRLPELGLSLKFEMGMVTGGMTTLMLQAGGDKAKVTEAQIFDTDGKAWPTLINSFGAGGEGSLQLMVAGKPKPPLSLALLVSGGGVTTRLPILIEKINVGAAEKGEPR